MDVPYRRETHVYVREILASFEFRPSYGDGQNGHTHNRIGSIRLKKGVTWRTECSLCMLRRSFNGTCAHALMRIISAHTHRKFSIRPLRKGSTIDSFEGLGTRLITEHFIEDSRRLKTLCKCKLLSWFVCLAISLVSVASRPLLACHLRFWLAFTTCVFAPGDYLVIWDHMENFATFALN